MRLAAPMSFGSRTRTRTRLVTLAPMRSILGESVLGGDDLDGDANAGVQSRWWCDLGGANSPVLGTLSSLSLSLSLFASPEMV